MTTWGSLWNPLCINQMGWIWIWSWHDTTFEDPYGDMKESLKAALSPTDGRRWIYTELTWHNTWPSLWRHGGVFGRYAVSTRWYGDGYGTDLTQHWNTRMMIWKSTWNLLCVNQTVWRWIWNWLDTTPIYGWLGRGKRGTRWTNSSFLWERWHCFITTFQDCFAMDWFPIERWTAHV